MLYPKNKESSLSADLFKNPTSEYRATPFWAWNGELKSDLLEKQIESLKEMGFGGFHMHVRVGLSTPYLSDEFMKCVSDCVNKAKKENMYAWLYDEDRWPSGFAGGLNTKKEENRQKFIKFTKIPYNDDYLVLKCDKDIATNDVPQSKYSLLQCFDIIFDANKKMVSYEVIDIYDRPNGEKWFAYLETAKNSPYYGGYTYCDTLKKSTIEDFIEITHEKYKSVVGDEFGKTVSAIFCD
ncbi:MAG: hypothetical protein MJ236_04610, partial [Clostridia bacterium]|nr:hypothetical protein [Clostridia bacterium]